MFMPDFTGGAVVKIPHFHCRRHGFDPCLGKFCMLLGGAKKKKKKSIPTFFIISVKLKTI